MTPTKMKAIVTVGDGTIKLTEVDVPKVEPGYCLVKVIAIAQNPTDWKTVEIHKAANSLVGCDFAGVIEEIGPDVPEGVERSVGERVASFVHGAIGHTGSFAEYVVAQAGLLIHIPDDWTFEQAAQIGIACYTTCQCLYQFQDLPRPVFDSEPTTTTTEGDEEKEPLDLLVWGGSSSVGQYLIQFASLAPPPGIRIISTSSPANHPLLLSIGASHVFEYKDSKTPKRIKEVTKGKLKCAVDCIGEKMTPFQVSESLSAEGGVISQIIPYKSRKKGVETRFALAYTIFGQAFDFPWKYEALPEHNKLAFEFAKLISKVLASGKVKPNPIKLFPKGLASVSEGFTYMKHGKVSAEKITYRIADTPGL